MRTRARYRVIPPYSTAAALEAYERDRTESVRGSTCERADPSPGQSFSDIVDAFEGEQNR